MGANGVEEAICNMRFRQNIEKPKHADFYSPYGGRVTILNSQNLPILQTLQLSAERGTLYQNAMLTPHWNINAHEIIYVLSGDARVQVVDNSGQTVYNGQLRRDQLLILPQNFAIAIQAGENGFEWVSFKTSDNAMVSTLAGRNSVIRAMPEEVLTNSYQISREEGMRLKFNRQEARVLSSRSSSANLMVLDKRICMNDENLEMYVCLKDWIDDENYLILANNFTRLLVVGSNTFLTMLLFGFLKDGEAMTKFSKVDFQVRVGGKCGRERESLLHTYLVGEFEGSQPNASEDSSCVSKVWKDESDVAVRALASSQFLFMFAYEMEFENG
ncbi:PREDICTED: 13S globulin basic chain-like [Nelumbo nucifera]|uniref:13S globulin basic chain-like n=1 Tax=Nelumbo nucifera TaxID=4432 RepID=A0A1U7ZGX7_NELNU|nr:PREDICTED: 13S globulin basic chain-like [Nelumbo nucifera]